MLFGRVDAPSERTLASTDRRVKERVGSHKTRRSPASRYRKFTAAQKVEIVLAGLNGDRPVREVCREHDISDPLYYQWHDMLYEGGIAALAGSHVGTESSGRSSRSRRRTRPDG
jgi:transposase-like protein